MNLSTAKLQTTLAIAAIMAVSASLHASEPVTFSKDVAPIFFEHCGSCHRPGEIAPMSLLTYKEARPWAKSIANEVSTRAMPPWSGDSDHRTWSNDISLSQEQIDTVVAWTQQGAPQGNPADTPEVPTFSDGWTLGEPDFVITLDAVDVPADGEDLFPRQFSSVDIEEERWIKAIEFLPSDRRVAHHMMLTYNNAPGGQLGSSANTNVGILAIWTAGMPPYVFPEGVGRMIGPNTKILGDLHYHPFGEAATDQTKVGLYFGDGPLQKEVKTITIANTGLRIPPEAPAHPELAFYSFDRDMQIVAFSPHLHVRGKAMRYEMTYPDGSTEILLDVPNYDYNWQWQYYPTEPIDAPAGSRLDVTAWWDNSADNKANPDPSQEIIYRGDTFSEMFVGFMEVVPKDGVHHETTPVKKRVEDLLAAHPAEDTYYVGGFIPFGLYLPEEGEGWMYLVQDLIMFTISLDDFERDGDSVVVTTQLPTPDASATTTVIEWDRNEAGKLVGKFSYGSDTPTPLTVPIRPQPMAPKEVNISKL